MVKFLLGAVVGFLIAAIVLPEDVRWREPIYEGWVATRVFVAELLSGVDQAAEQAIEATQEATEDVERAMPGEEPDAGEAARGQANDVPREEPPPAAAQ